MKSVWYFMNKTKWAVITAVGMGNWGTSFVSRVKFFYIFLTLSLVLLLSLFLALFLCRVSIFHNFSSKLLRLKFALMAATFHTIGWKWNENPIMFNSVILNLMLWVNGDLSLFYRNHFQNEEKYCILMVYSHIVFLIFYVLKYVLINFNLNKLITKQFV